LASSSSNMPSWPPSNETLEELYLRRGMSTHQIAKLFGVSGSTVFRWLRKLRIPLRNRRDAYTKAVTKYAKKLFSGDRLEAAYMIGLRLSDFDARWARREGGTIAVRTRTTHPGMIQLARATFGFYGAVVMSPRKINHGGYCWEIECHLNHSFSFLVSKPTGIPEWILHDSQAFLHFLAAFIDGDGWVGLHNCWGVKAIPKVGLSNTDHLVINGIVQGLLNLEYVVKPRVNKKRGSVSSYGMLNEDVLRVELKGNNAAKLLKALPLRHPEKLMRRALALQLHGKAWKDAKPEWDKLLATINTERDKCVAVAEKAHDAKKKSGGHAIAFSSI